MAKMVLSTSTTPASTGTTFTTDPGKMTMLRADKVCSHMLTYSSVVYFSWGSTITGKNVILEWNAMKSTMFDALDTIYQADSTVYWNPNIPGSTALYKVVLTGLDGEYFINQESSAQFYRTNCKLSLLILSTA